MNILFVATRPGAFKVELVTSGEPCVKLLTFSEDIAAPGVVRVHTSEGRLLCAEEVARQFDPHAFWAWTLDWLKVHALRVDVVAHGVQSPAAGALFSKGAPAPEAHPRLKEKFIALKEAVFKESESMEHVFFAADKLNREAVLKELTPPPACRNSKVQVRCTNCVKI